jgi:hypothetical protein
MDTVIRDGTGGCNGAKVDGRFRVGMIGVVETAIESARENERAFVITSGDFELTTDSESGILYLKNNEDSKLVIDRIIVGYGLSTGGSGQPKSKTYFNPTGGTVISDETDAVTLNLDTGSAISLSADAYSGGEGKTIVGTGLATTMFEEAPGYDTTLPGAVIRKGSTAAISVIPPAGNTSMVFNVTLYVYLSDYV